MPRHLTALVIGNAAYTQINKLNNPANDATDVAAKLAARGFTVIEKTDCTHKEMDLALKEFRASLTDSDVALFFFSGHGMQIDGENYLAAVDADFGNETDAKHSSLPLNRVIETLEKSGTPTKIIILDACRNNPFEFAWHRSAATRGLASVYAPRGTIIAFATSPGQIALDGTGRNGRYTAALLKHIDRPDCSLENMFKRVRNTLSAATKGKQISWEHTSLAGEFFFNLSLGARIDAYSDQALSDRLFVLDDSKTSHRLIQGLKTLDWYRQNPAVSKITPDLINSARPDSPFVLGRNIYQAACGSSNGAIEYLSGFMTRTRGVDEARRKALLDGMLFEIFFDSRAQLREQPKNRYLEQVFDLQQYDELSDSFAFISECLLAHPDRFHAIPGKSREITVDVVTKKKAGKPKTQVYYENGLNNLLAFDRLAGQRIDEITGELIAAYVATRNAVKLEISSINRELQVLRRMFNLAYEWKVVERPLDRVRMLKGENQRDRVLTSHEEKRYLGQAAPLLHDVATVLVDCSLRPEECFRLKPVHVQHGNLEIPWGKTENAVRKIPMTPRVEAIIKVRDRSRDGSLWLFPAPTASGHIEPSSLKKQHAKACRLAKIEPFDLYTFRHTCLTRWAPHMDVFTLQYLAGHSDIRTTRRYVHPQQQDTLKAMVRARKAQRGHTSRHTAKKTPKKHEGRNPRK